MLAEGAALRSPSARPAARPSACCSGANVLADKNVLDKMGGKALATMYGALLDQEIPDVVPDFIAHQVLFRVFRAFSFVPFIL